MLFIARTTKKQTINYHHLKLLSEKSIVNIYALGEKKTELIMKFLGWVVQMLISTNPGLKFHPIFVQMPFLDNFFIFLLEHPVFKLETKRVIIKLFFKAFRSEIIRGYLYLSLNNPASKIIWKMLRTKILGKKGARPVLYRSNVNWIELNWARTTAAYETE